MSQRLHSKGFSIVELLIVVVIILIIAAIAIPNLLQVRDKENFNKFFGSKPQNEKACMEARPKVLEKLGQMQRDVENASDERMRTDAKLRLHSAKMAAMNICKIE